MTGRHIVSLFMISLILLINQTGFGAEARQPSIKLLDNFYDFGFVPIDYKLIHTFQIRNDGQAGLVINKLVPNCDCTHAQVMDTLVAPDSITTIKILFDTKNYYGPSTRHITVHSNDPDNPAVELEYASAIGMVPRYFKVEPQSLFYLPGHKSKKITLINLSEDKLKYDLEIEPGSLFTVNKTSGEIDSRDSTILDVQPLESLPRGTHYSNFTVNFGDKSDARLTVPVKIVRY
nr:DUF1573 domain-containing protein [candidate division Zixibacteria bacterium]